MMKTLRKITTGDWFLVKVDGYEVHTHIGPRLLNPDWKQFSFTT